MINLQEKAIKSTNISGGDEVFTAFLSAIKKMETLLNDESFEHPMVGMVREAGVLSACAGDDELIEHWIRKYNTVPCIVLTDIPGEPDEAESDPLGFFFNAKDINQQLLRLGCCSEEIHLKMEQSLKIRQAHNSDISSAICIKYEPVKSFCRNHNLALEDTIFLVLFHETGHLVFNPSLYKLVGHAEDDYALEDPHPDLETPVFPYKRSKPYQFLVEGMAEWFAFQVSHMADTRVSDTLFIKDPLSDSAYAYYLELNRLHPLYFSNIIVSFYFNCLRTCMTYLPADDSNLTKLSSSDFSSVPYQGRDLFQWSSYASRISRGLKDRRIGLDELITIGFVTADLVEMRYIHPSVIEFAGISEAGDLYGFLPCPSGSIQYYDTGVPENKFDDYMLPGEAHRERPSETLSLGMRYDGQYGQVVAISDAVNQGQDAWWISLNMNKKEREKILFARSSSWSLEPARRTAFYGWRSFGGKS